MRIDRRLMDKAKNNLPKHTINNCSDIKLISSLPEFGSRYSMYNSKDVCHGLNGDEWLSGARPV
jgi:hypothetical protein